MAGDNNVSNVTKGGLWNSQQVTYSKETHKLLKELMRESKLTMFQQKHLDGKLKDGMTLPLRVPPTHRHVEEIPVEKPSPSKVFTLRQYSGAGIRSRFSMEKDGAFDRPDYRPRPQRGRTEKDKERLCNIMAYGKDIPPPSKTNVQRRNLPQDEFEIDRFEELQDEIAERKNFLDDMTALGRGDDYRHLINTEISQKVREMELIDKKRCQELDERLKEDVPATKPQNLA